MNALSHSCRSQRGASFLAALSLSLVFGSSCSRGNGGSASTPEGSRSDRAAASSAGSRAVRVLDERCAPRGAAAPPPTARSPYIGKTVQKANECVKQADCAARPYGRCVARAEQTNFYHGTAIIIPAHTACLYDECTSDAECRAHGQYEPRSELVCHCDAKEQNTCTFANCRADADCPPPYACGSYQYCHSADDECQKPGDCTGGTACTFSWEKRRYLCIAPQAPQPG